MLLVLLGFCVLLARVTLGNIEQPRPGGLQADRIWHHFSQILSIPRCSGNEEKLQEYIRTFAAEHNLQVVKDAARNLIVKRPGSGIGASAAPVILQTHIDMVCEKNSDSVHDWRQDPVVAVQRDGWLTAENTTLGADNGIGVALSLALLEQPSSFTAPPLEAIFTVEEETGLYGALGLDTTLLTGRQLLNFDSEEWGIVYIGCAGGGDSFITLPLSAETSPPMVELYKLTLAGLKGGHSGADIHEYRGNALLLLARAISELQNHVPRLRLLDLVGGGLDNAIPREASATVGVEKAALPALRAAATSIEAKLKQEYGRMDANLTLHLTPEDAASLAATPHFSELTATQLIDLLLTLPNGVIKKSHEVEGLVETSNNVARVQRTGPDTLEVLCLARSSIASALGHVRESIARAARLSGAQAVHEDAFPGWAPNRSQKLLAITEDVFEEVEGSKPEVAAIHAGLECGVIGDKIPGIEMVSFGPDIQGAHAPGERVRVASVERLVVLVERLLRRLSGERSSSSARGKETSVEL